MPTSGLTMTVEAGPEGWSRIYLSGVIDERTDLAEVFSKCTGDTIFDLSGVSRINSIGVLKWVQQFGEFAGKHRVALERLSYPMALQANHVANLFEGAEVRSTEAPYYCAACDANRTATVSAVELASAEGAPPAKACEECEGPMEFDDLDSYFTFLREPHGR